MMEGKALTASTRSGDPDYPGLLRIVAERHRVAVNPDGTRYQLQHRIETPQGEVWVPRAYASLAALLKAQASKVQGLAHACKGLPENPCEAVPPKLRAGRAALLGAFQATDWRRQDYRRKIRQEGNLRLSVDPQAVQYRLQWVAPSQYHAGPTDNWKTVKKSPALSEMAEFIRQGVYDVVGDWSDRESIERLALTLTDGLPEWVGDGDWPQLPQRP